MVLRAMSLPVMSFAAVAVPDTARNSARNATAIVLDGRRLRMECKTTSVDRRLPDAMTIEARALRSQRPTG
jgi:hypothetical protein